MPAKVMVPRTDHTPGHLRELARKHRFRGCRRRLRAIAPVMEDGLSRAAVASGAGVGARTLRDRVVRYNAGGLDGLRDAARPGAPPKLESGPAREVASWLEDGPDPDAREGFGGDSVRLAREAVPDGVAPEDVPVYLQDGARVGRKGMLPGVRARRGTRPRIVRDHRYGHLYLSPPPACPATGDAVGHVCGRASTAETDRHLRETGGRVPAGKRALVVPGGAGRHRSKDLGIPDSVSLPRLPPTARSSTRAGRCSPS